MSESVRMKDGNIFLTKEEKENIHLSLSLRLGLIETGTSHMRARDAINMGKHKAIKPLDTAQMQLIIDTEKLMGKMFDD
jgi:hypothetical protein